MQQLIPYFSGKEHPLGRRLFNIQKCVRTIDIDEVGDDTHLTMFEMMGNRSLGDYFKKESIQRSWEFLTDKKWLWEKIDPKKIAVTVFAGDDNAPRDEESAIYWKDVGVHKISYLWADDNRRSPGPVGPCGPDTEIFYRIGDKRGGPAVPPEDSDVASDPDNWMEIWNNVFMQYYRDESWNLTKLSAQSVDTGMWFERMCMVLQDTTSPYDTDIFAETFNMLPGHGVKYINDEEKNKELLKKFQSNSNARIFVDHMRTSFLLIHSWIIPSNTWPGYISRSLIRRAYFLFIWEDGIDLNIQTQESLESMQAYWEKFYNISIPNGAEVIWEEILKFQKTLKWWYKEFQKIVDATKWNIIEWKKVFFLSDTFWFPIDLTKKLAQNADMTIDEEGFQKALEEQKTRSRKATKSKFSIDIDRSTYVQDIPETVFVGYDALEYQNPKLLKDFTVKEQRILVFDRTPLYAEGWWQTGDRGVVIIDSWEQLTIQDVKNYEWIFLHFVL